LLDTADIVREAILQQLRNRRRGFSSGRVRKSFAASRTQR
jgi:hypothetical protein